MYFANPTGVQRVARKRQKRPAGASYREYAQIPGRLTEEPLRRLLGLLCAAIAATTLFALNEEPALANTVHCGDLIAQDTILTADLYCPGASGLFVQGDATLDLGGHTISGSGVGEGVGASLGALTIRNGTISGFQYGIAVGKA